VLKILAGLHGADGGSVKIGNAQTPFDPARDIGMVFQQALLLKWRTILHNVLLPAEIVGLPGGGLSSPTKLVSRATGRGLGTPSDLRTGSPPRAQRAGERRFGAATRAPDLHAMVAAAERGIVC
jgi:ABC-type sugar transport system ATPase subunit